MEVLPILFALCNLVGVMSRACGYDAMLIDPLLLLGIDFQSSCYIYLWLLLAYAATW